MRCTVTPFLWMESGAERAAKLYVSLFPRSRVTSVTRHGRGASSVAFEIAGQRVVALNGGPTYRLSPAFSFLVACDGQAEIDFLWRRLVRGGQPMRCGWLEDRFGVTWQIIPAELPGLIRHPRAMEVMMGMQKIDLAALRAATKQRA